ncbi:MAG: hypothetical protein JXJ20_10820 [Anaerolineae bacterium]|nr:hypothetical protein [Anaerolineae bacterium]
MRKGWIVLGLVTALVLVLAGCGGDDGGETKPSATPSQTPQPSPTPYPPTWTPLPPGFVPSPSPEAVEVESNAGSEEATEAEPVTGGQVLPPTWTPWSRPTVTPLPTSALGDNGLNDGGSLSISSPVPQAPTWTPLPDYCNELNPRGEDPEIYIGEAATIKWDPIASVPMYLVEVRQPGGGIVLNEYTEGASMTISSETFEARGVYGWQVWPVDANGMQICFPISGEIIVLD